MESPKSLTAVVHVRFHYNQAGEPPRQGEIEVMGKLLDKASDMDPELQELLVKFADWVGKSARSNGEGKQSPG